MTNLAGKLRYEHLEKKEKKNEPEKADGLIKTENKVKVGRCESLFFPVQRQRMTYGLRTIKFHCLRVIINGLRSSKFYEPEKSKITKIVSSRFRLQIHIEKENPPLQFSNGETNVRLNV